MRTWLLLGIWLGSGFAVAEDLGARLDKLKRDLHVTLAIPPRADAPVIGIVGDSLAGGSSAALRGGADAAIAPQRIFDTPASAEFGFRRAFTLAGAAGIDCEECSFGFHWARARGVPRENIFFAAQGGARVDAVAEQLARLALPLGRLPETILVSFTGNDICSLANLSADGKSLSAEGAGKWDEVRDTLARQLREGLARERAAQGGTRIVVLGAADVTELLTNPAILDHETPVAGRDEDGRGKTCRDLRRGAFPLLNQMCPLLLNTRPGDETRLGLIRALHAAVVDGQRAAVELVRAELAPRGFTLEFRDAFRGVRFGAGDVSDDCFHPSGGGHRRLTELLERNLDSIK